MPSRTPFGPRALARRGETAGVPLAESAECSSRRLAARTVNYPYYSSSRVHPTCSACIEPDGVAGRVCEEGEPIFLIQE